MKILTLQMNLLLEPSLFLIRQMFQTLVNVLKIQLLHQGVKRKYEQDLSLNQQFKVIINLKVGVATLCVLPQSQNQSRRQC